MNEPNSAPPGATVTVAGRPTSLPSLPQLVRFRKRASKAHDALEDASYYLLEALRAYDGDKIPTKHNEAMAWEDAHAVEAAIDALKSLLAVAGTYADNALKARRAEGKR
jgi:hypothetical protein